MKAIIICLAILSLLSVSNEKKIRFLAAGLGGMGGLSMPVTLLIRSVLCGDQFVEHSQQSKVHT